MHAHDGIVADIGLAAPVRTNISTRPMTGPHAPDMTVSRAHQIVPTLLADGPWGEGIPLLDPAGRSTETWPHRGERAGNTHRRFARCALRPQPCAVKAARYFTHATLCSFDTCELFDDASVVISELVTNAVRYGLRPGLAKNAPAARIEVLLLRQASHLVCVVTDSNPGPPTLLEPDFAAETGRGLYVVEALSSRWGWTPLHTGHKAVWATLTLSPGDEERTSPRE